MISSSYSSEWLINRVQPETSDLVPPNSETVQRRWTMRFNMRIAISVLTGAVLLGLLGVGIWRMVEAEERGERHDARSERIGPNDQAAITADQAITAGPTLPPNTTPPERTLQKEAGGLLYCAKPQTLQAAEGAAN